MLKTVFGGLVAIAIAFILELPFAFLLRPLENFYGAVIVTAIIAPSVEETVKAFSTIKFVGRIHPDSGFFVGLRFGIIETIMYIASYASTIEQALILGSLRLAVSVPLHAACTAMFLYGLYMRSKDRSDRLSRIISAYLIHGLFNFTSVTV